MRFIWALSIACIVAAPGVRPELEVQRVRQVAGELDPAPAKLSYVATRPDVASARGHLPRPQEVRLPPYLLPAPPASLAPGGPRPQGEPARLTSTLSRLIPAARTARGPPAAFA
jgi:hypothetical protein